MLTRRFFKNAKLSKQVARLQSGQVPQKTSGQSPAKLIGMQFGKQELVDFGELPRGKIPAQLQYSPEHKLSKLDNNATVVTEFYQGDHAAVSIFLRGGSRYEDIASSGSARMLSHLFLRGTNNRTRQDVERLLDEMGAQVQLTFEREMVGLTIRVAKEDVTRAVDLLTEMVVEVKIDDNQIEAEKESVINASMDLCRDQWEQSIESVFYTSFRDHMMGQPSRGNRDNIPNLTSTHLKEHMEKTFAGRNFTVVVSGNANHDEVLQAASKRLSHLPAAPSRETAHVNVEKPLLTPSLMVTRDDEMANINVAVSYLAPHYAHPHKFFMQFIQHMVGDYNANDNGHAHLNAANRQYNYLHRLLGEAPGISLQHTEYYGFSDVGLFTTWIHGNDVWSKEMMHVCQYMLGKYSTVLDQVEVFRARASLFNSLLEQKPSAGLNAQIAKDVQYIGRRVNRTELAYRYSCMADASFIQTEAKKWFYAKETGVAVWGPCHNYVKELHYYNNNLINATRGNPFVLI